MPAPWWFCMCLPSRLCIDSHSACPTLQPPEPLSMQPSLLLESQDQQLCTCLPAAQPLHQCLHLQCPSHHSNRQVHTPDPSAVFTIGMALPQIPAPCLLCKHSDLKHQATGTRSAHDSDPEAAVPLTCALSTLCSIEQEKIPSS